MSRRYLTIQEARETLRRGKSVEIFLGGFEFNSEKCIRWASFIEDSSGIIGNLWESYDQGSTTYIDVYTFDSPSGEYDEPVKVVHSSSLENAAKELGVSDLKFVNQGVIQDEYISYLESNT
ncbi:MAG: hypothetical protein KZQ73_04570 [Candidatus Thiodiazotropha sp. (ex Semelilucina semeliformis)]|nr:hypothetical protein [Candidatus Thiodiazotropha sp. (ex Semelilucina semeliformis)]